MSISERLFATLETKKLKLSDLANSLGVNKSVVSTSKSRKTNPPVEYMVRICDFLSISYDYYLTGFDSIDTAGGATTLHEDEQELINIYVKLDHRGKCKVNTVAYEELDRVRAILDPEQPNQVG